MTDFDVKFGIGESVMLQSGISVSLSEEKSDGAIPLKKEALCGILRLRSRRDGDTIRQKGKTHKIKRMISDKKLSACEKEKLFFLTSDGAIVFTNIPAISDTAFTKGGENCVYLTIKESL